MFSGGIDSTGVFWQLFQEGLPLYVHHMNLKNKENRWEAESFAVRNIVEYMRGVGAKFEYTESTHEYPSFKGKFLWDADLTSFMAGHICSVTPSIKHIALGLTATDMERPIVTGRIEKANKILAAFTSVTKIYPAVHMTKRELYEMMPVSLRSLCWSCRTPKYTNDRSAVACGRCRACKESSFDDLE